MKQVLKILCIVLFGGLTIQIFAEDKKPVPTHADAAIVFSKYSGLFDRYVAPDATLTECVSFLNQHGIYFGLMEVVNGDEFTLNDCARVMGQIELVMTAEASYATGKVILPNGIDSWKNYCILNGVNYEQGYAAILLALSTDGE